MSMDEATEIVNNASKKAGKPWGCPAFTPEMLTNSQQQGAQFLVVSKESGGWRNELKQGMTTFGSQCEERR